MGAEARPTTFCILTTGGFRGNARRLWQTARATAVHDRGNRYGLYVNGAKVQQHLLRDGDVITFGVENFYQIVFHAGIGFGSAPAVRRSVANLLTRIGTLSDLTGNVDRQAD